MIGVIGLGRMGGGIARTLLQHGMPLAIYDIDSSRRAAVAAVGAETVDSSAALCSRCDTIILSLLNSQTAVQVMEHEVLPAASEGSVVIDMGTTVASETRRLHGLMAERGVALLDAPVSGGSVGASSGTLYVFVGGEKAVADSNWDTLSVLGGNRLTYCGGPGCGQITKAVNQLAMGLVDAAFLEAVAFGVNAGVDAATLEQAVGGDSGFRVQFKSIAGRAARGEADAMDVKYAEHAYFLDEAYGKGFPSPLLEALYSYMKRFPETSGDNMERPYPPLWSALTDTAVRG